MWRPKRCSYQADISRLTIFTVDWPSLLIRITADRAVLSLAHCSFYMNRFLEASDLFTKWLNDNFDAPESAEAQADLRQCLAIIAQNKEWEKGPYPGSAPPARSGLIVRFLDWAGQKLHY